MATAVKTGKNWKILFDKGTSYVYIKGRTAKGRYVNKLRVPEIAREKTKLMFVKILKQERTTVEEDNNDNINWIEPK